MSDAGDKSPELVILKQINGKIVFHRRWKNIVMTLYVFTTVGTVICTFAATILALLGFKLTTSILTGFATILISIEKGLMFREKWKLHLNVYTRLENIRLGLESGVANIDTTVKDTQNILEEYSRELPIEMRKE
jgi:hypothetical protein